MRLFAQQLLQAPPVEGELGGVEETVHGFIRNRHDFGVEPGAGFGERGEQRFNAVDPGAIRVVGGVFVRAQVGVDVHLFAETLEVVERLDRLAERRGAFRQPAAKGEKRLRQRPDAAEIGLPRIGVRIDCFEIPGLFCGNDHDNSSVSCEFLIK